MKKALLFGTFSILTLLMASPVLAAPYWDNNPKAFVHGIALDIDGMTLYFKGPGSVEGAIDVPGHTWVQTGSYRVKGRHYNIGPSGTPSWWATGEPNGILLFVVDGIIDAPPGELPEGREDWLKDRGYVHFHELVFSDGTTEYEDLVVYLKHTAVREFYFDGGPMAPMYWVYPGIDYNFMPNW